MNDRMTPLSFEQLMGWLFWERDSIFGVRSFFRASDVSSLISLFGDCLEVPCGPAAGPHTQLAQNIIAAYVAGGRFFELKTVQTLDGEDLPVAKPCIYVPDEGYNVEWSTELTVQDALDEYIKAWFALKLLSKELELGDPNGFIFNMSVGYDFEGITSPKIDYFIESLKDAHLTPIWETCTQWALGHLSQFEHVDAAYVHGISPYVSQSITLSTLHGCPPQTIEQIATYLLTKKNLHTYIKCNPTLLGYDFTRGTLDQLGYDDLVFDAHHFQNDLQFEDAVPMIQRLLDVAQVEHLTFGVKLTNTFPVTILAKELPGEEMYMSGPALFPLSLTVASRLARAFDGKLNISYSGGADAFNCAKLLECGIYPITLATTLLKPGGYNRLVQLAQTLLSASPPPTIIDTLMLEQLATEACTSIHYVKSQVSRQVHKLQKPVPLTSCFTPPCQNICPIAQDIPKYIRLVGEGKFLEALQAITDKNPLPFTTGTLCNHTCTQVCRRNFYEAPLDIRGLKLRAAQEGFDELMCTIDAPSTLKASKVAIIGSGPAGLATAYFLARGGLKVMVYEKRKSLGGIVRYAIPEFRMPKDDLNKDIRLITSYGVGFTLGQEITSFDSLRQQGYDYIVTAIGATIPSILPLEEGTPLHVLDFLESFKSHPNQVNLGKHVVIIGGGNTAMDAARAATRVSGVETVSIVYRRTKRYMPADAEEIELTLKENVRIKELLSPLTWENGKLLCEHMILGAPDATGRRSPVSTHTLTSIAADTVISAIGEHKDAHFFKTNGILLDKQGNLQYDKNTLEIAPNIFVAGDALAGPSTVVLAIQNAQTVANTILQREKLNPTKTTTPIICTATPSVSAKTVQPLAFTHTLPNPAKRIHSSLDHDATPIFANRITSTPTTSSFLSSSKMFSSTKTIASSTPKDELIMPTTLTDEPSRCLNCDYHCECCVDVCPNRANVTLIVAGEKQILHIDNLCNACGNCTTFCPYTSSPYKDKFTLFHTPADFQTSTNEGFLILDPTTEKIKIRYDNQIQETLLKDWNDNSALHQLIATVIQDYRYLL